ncbi:MAG TPA: ribosome-associated translation inhibitor RaiA [Candidatus Peribacteraceae bacterium]|nr:ribosome-associated translation inhibitor RaiA [Candidatus Peribacteraceae bacterium]
MNIEHFEKGLTYNDRELLFVARKLGKLATHCSRLKDESSVIRVEAERRETKKTRDETKVMITVELPQKMMRAESRKATFLEAFDRAVEKLEPQLVKYKELRSSKGRQRKARSGRAA